MWCSHTNPFCTCARRGLPVISVWCSHVFPLCACTRQPLKAGCTIFALSVPHAQRCRLSLFLPLSLCPPLGEAASLPPPLSLFPVLREEASLPLSFSLHHFSQACVHSNKLLSGFVWVSCSLLTHARSFHWCCDLRDSSTPGLSPGVGIKTRALLENNPCLLMP